MLKTSLLAAGAVAVFSLVSLVGVPPRAQAGNVVLNNPDGTEFSFHVTSIRERRFKTVVMQQYDYSCGAAAIATLLTYTYGRPTPEQEPFVKMIENGDKEKIQQVGFSMLDMKHYLESTGYHAIGVKVTLDELKDLGVPGIALIEFKQYKHFVVIRAVDDRRVLLADPALGMQIIPRDEFEKMWDGVLLLNRDDADVARQNFNEQAFWAVRPPAPIGTMVGQNGLAIFSQNLPLHNIFIVGF